MKTQIEIESYLDETNLSKNIKRVLLFLLGLKEKNKFRDYNLAFSLFRKQLNWDVLDLYKNGFIPAEAVCRAFVSNNNSYFFNSGNNLVEYIEANLDVSLEEFLLQNFKLYIEQLDQEKEWTGSVSDNFEGCYVPYEICQTFVHNFGMDMFIERFSNFYNFSFLKTINKLSSPQLDPFAFAFCTWNNREIDNILLEFIYNNTKERYRGGFFLSKEIEFNYLPDMPTTNGKIDFYNNIHLTAEFFNSNKPQIIISSTKTDFSGVFSEMYQNPITNRDLIIIPNRRCIITQKQRNIIHVCFYNVSYESLFDSLTLSDVRSLKWNKFIHLDDTVLTANEDEETTYPKFYQLLIDNRFKFKKLVTNILQYDTGIDHFALTHDSSHKEWLDNYPFQSEEIRLKFKKLNLDSTFNDFFRDFTEIDQNRPNFKNFQIVSGLTEDNLQFYRIKQN